MSNENILNDVGSFNKNNVLNTFLMNNTGMYDVSCE